jgi:predicted amidohydrolase
MSKSTLQIALVQMTAVDSLAANLEKFESIFNSILSLKAQNGPSFSLDLICFPENCLFMRVKTSDPIEGLSCRILHFSGLVSGQNG